MSDRPIEALDSAKPSSGGAPRRNRGPPLTAVAGTLAQLIAGAAFVLASFPISELSYSDTPRPHWTYVLEAAGILAVGALALGSGIRLLPPRSEVRAVGIIRIIMFVVAGAFLSLAVLVLTNIFDAMKDNSDALFVREALLLAAMGVVPLAVGLWLVRWR